MAKQVSPINTDPCQQPSASSRSPPPGEAADGGDVHWRCRQNPFELSKQGSSPSMCQEQCLGSYQALLLSQETWVRYLSFSDHQFSYSVAWV